ncbi:MAG: hypothetical protein OEY24_01735 [Candidatus Bathyarchaeota archaeon]|nr:hypothetical protein [Candidatus Bathyarchaeota archaeon]MDH5494410.1 hypothetical protein [Candidatus Bathyarchaeota archaeon]
MKEHMKIYFDTNVADFAFTAKCWEENKKDVKFSGSKDIDMTKNILALRYLLDLNIEWNLTFGTSILMKREIEKIRFEDNLRYYAQKHLFLETFYYTLEHLSSRIFEKRQSKKPSIKEEKRMVSKEAYRNCRRQR